VSLNLVERRIKLREDKDLKADNLERMIQDSDENFRKLREKLDDDKTPQFQGVQITADWRIRIDDGGNFVVEKLENEVWTEKLGVTP
jgi:hypothetical protein